MHHGLDLSVLLGQLHLNGHLADIMNQPGGADFLGIAHRQAPGQHVADHGAAQGVLPEFPIVILHELEDRGADNQALDNTEAQQNNGAL